MGEKTFQVTEITEADYGCEECPPDGPHALVYLCADDGEERRLEVSERYLSESGIDEGARVTVGEDGRMLNGSIKRDGRKRD